MVSTDVSLRIGEYRDSLVQVERPLDRLSRAVKKLSMSDAGLVELGAYAPMTIFCAKNFNAQPANFGSYSPTRLGSSGLNRFSATAKVGELGVSGDECHATCKAR